MSTYVHLNSYKVVRSNLIHNYEKVETMKMLNTKINKLEYIHKMEYYSEMEKNNNK